LSRGRLLVGCAPPNRQPPRGGLPGPFENKINQPDASGEELFERETRSIGESVVSEYLWWRGLDHVDYILATHADADHIDGLNDVARNFTVRAALVARTPDNDDVKMLRDGSRWIALAKDASSLADLMKIDVWQPLSATRETRLWTDDYSDVLSVIKW